MAGTAQAADRIRCDRCSGHYVVDAASDGSPRVRCNKCGHVRDAADQPSPASIPGKWTVIGPDGKAMSFDTWEELTESRRPSAITPTAKGMEEANHALKDLKPAAQQEKKSASALLDITPAPKLALADMDSAIDLGEPLGGSRKSRPGASTMMSGSGAPSSTGKLEPLLVRSFSQPPKTQSSPSKVEWAPKLDNRATPLRADDNTMRVEIAPAQLAESRPSNHDRAAQAVQIAPAPATTRVIDAERPTAPTGGVVAADDSIDELDPDSLLEDPDDEDEAPLSLRDAIPDDELGDEDLQEEPDPHELLSIRDLVVAEPAEAKKPTLSAPPPRPSQLPPAPARGGSLPPKPTLSAPPKLAVSQAPPKVTTSHAPPKATHATQIEAKVVVTPSTPPRPKSLSRPDAPANHSRPPPSIRPDAVSEPPPGEQEETTKRTRIKVQPAPNRTWMYVALAAVLIAGVGWRLMQNTDPPPPPPPKPTPTVATIVPPTPVTAPTETPSATPTASETIAIDTPPTTPTGATTTVTTPPTTPTGATNVVTPPTTPTEKKPVAENTSGGTAPSATPTEKKPSVPVGDAPGSMSELLDKAGSAKRKGDLATARELYGRVIAMSPANVEANGGLGDVAKAQGDLGAAKTSYERALAASPTYSPALLGLADVEWDQGNQASAKKRYAQIIDRLGDRAPARAKERAQ